MKQIIWQIKINKDIENLNIIVTFYFLLMLTFQKILIFALS